MHLANRLCSSRHAAFVLGAVLLLVSFRASAALEVTVRLRLDGRDVTSAHAESLVRFIPHSKAPDGRVLEELNCLVKQTCYVPAGAYSVDLDDEGYVVESRPRLFVGAQDQEAASITLSLVPAAYVTVPGIPKGGMLQALDERLAVLHSRRVYSAAARVRIPARPVVLCAYDPKGVALGCWPVTAKAGETVALAGLPKLATGRGQLVADFLYPSRDAAHDVAVTLRQGDAIVRPDVVVSAHPDRHFAVWYDVAAGPASLEVSSPLWAVGAPVTVTVPDRDITVKRSIPLVRRGASN